MRIFFIAFVFALLALAQPWLTSAQAQGPPSGTRTFETPPPVTIILNQQQCPGCGSGCQCPAGVCPNCPATGAAQQQGCGGCQAAEGRRERRVLVIFQGGFFARLRGRCR
jgi:hypothetical protein